MKRARGLFVAFSLLTLSACGGESISDTNTGGAGGGSGGGGAQAGTGGGGSGGVGAGGTGAVSGGGGSSGVGGGTAGSAGGPPATGVVGECKVDTDCELKSSCCECLAGKKGTLIPGPCDLALCDMDMCTNLGVEQARCIAGQCTIAANCDMKQATCKSLPPKCPEGTTITLNSFGCWGPCLPHTACAQVEDCFVCPAGTICIVNSAWESTHHCVNPNPNCGGGCQCLAPLACIEPYTECGEFDDGSAAHCACPTC